MPDASAPAQPDGLTVADVVRLTGGRAIAHATVDDVRIRRVAPLAEAGDDALTFLADARYLDAFATSRAGTVLITPALVDAPGAAGAVRVVVDRPHAAMLTVLPTLYPTPPRAIGVHPTASLGSGVRVGAGVTVGAHASIGDAAVLGDGVWVGAHCVVAEGVRVGDASELRPHVTLYRGTVLGARVIVQSGARIGGDGFGYVYANGAHQKIPHVGGCVLEDDVEVGANTTIDRGSIGDTVVGAGTKIDNLVHIGHNVRIGRLCLLMAQVGIAGSATVGDGVIIAGQVGVGGHVFIGDGARIAGQAGVFGDVPAGETWGGYPARPQKESLRAHAALPRLAAMLRPLERLVALHREETG